MGKIDKGHYVEAPLPKDSVRIRAGESLPLVLTADGSGNDLHFVLESDARLDLCLLMLPRRDEHITLTVDFVGRGAEASLSGLYICRGGVNLSLDVIVRHREGGTVSTQLFKGIAAESATATFDGRIVVAPDAQKIKALQANHNLLLSATARVETRPQLEIYADDVECSHGATVGALNLDEQFYMRSRGIPEEEARVLQMISFLAPVLATVPDARRRAALRRKLEGIVRSL